MSEKYEEGGQVGSEALLRQQQVIHPDAIVSAGEVSRTRRLQVVKTETAIGLRQYHSSAMIAGDDVSGVAVKMLERFAGTEEFGVLMSEPNGAEQVATKIVDAAVATMNLLEAKRHMVYIGPLYTFERQDQEGTA